MQRFVLALCLLLAGPSAGVTLSSVQKKREHLLPILNSLADALRLELSDPPRILDEKEVIAGTESDVEEEKAARKRLEMEAERLASEGGRGSKLAASLVRNLARRRVMADTSQFASPVISQSAISGSTVLSDGNGHSRMLKVKRCKNGACEEYTQSSSPENKVDPKKSIEQTDKPTSNKTGKKLSVVRQPSDDDISRAVNAFRGLDDSMEFNDHFTAPDIFGLSDDFWNRFRAPALHRHGVAKGAQAFEASEPASNAESSEAFQNSESVSSQAIMKNGRVVRQTTRCKNGKCKTIVEEGSLVPGSGDSEAKQPRPPAAPDADTVLQNGPEW